MLNVSNDDDVLIFIDNGDEVASLAVVSKFSFPVIPMCEGTYIKHIGFLFQISISEFVGKVNFLGRGLRLMRKFKESLITMLLLIWFKYEMNLSAS